MTAVLVSVPNMNWIQKHVCMATDRILMDRRYAVNIIRPTHKPYENNLHHILNEFMDGTYSHWLNIDADNPPMRNPLDLIELNLDIVSMPTPIIFFTGQDAPVYWNAYKTKNDGYIPWPVMEDLQEVDATGSGAVLYSRKVFENPEMRKAPFQRTFYPDGTVEKGCDIAFSERAKAQGIKIHAHYGYPCRHFNEVDAHEMTQEFKRYYHG